MYGREALNSGTAGAMPTDAVATQSGSHAHCACMQHWVKVVENAAMKKPQDSYRTVWLAALQQASAGFVASSKQLQAHLGPGC